MKQGRMTFARTPYAGLRVPGRERRTATVYDVDPEVGARFMAAVRAKDAAAREARAAAHVDDKCEAEMYRIDIPGEKLATLYQLLRDNTTTAVALQAVELDCAWETAKKHLKQAGYDVSFVAKRGGPLSKKSRRQDEAGKVETAPGRPTVETAPAPAWQTVSLPLPQRNGHVSAGGPSPSPAGQLAALQELLSSLQARQVQVTGSIRVALEINIDVGQEA